MRSNAEGEIGFLRDLPRMCVALSRAKLSLHIVGDPITLRKNVNWSQVYDYIKCSSKERSQFPLVPAVGEKRVLKREIAAGGGSISPEDDATGEVIRREEEFRVYIDPIAAQQGLIKPAAWHQYGQATPQVGTAATPWHQQQSSQGRGQRIPTQVSSSDSHMDHMSGSGGVNMGDLATQSAQSRQILQPKYGPSNLLYQSSYHHHHHSHHHHMHPVQGDPSQGIRKPQSPQQGLSGYYGQTDDMSRYSIPPPQISTSGPSSLSQYGVQSNAWNSGFGAQYHHQQQFSGFATGQEHWGSSGWQQHPSGFNQFSSQHPSQLLYNIQVGQSINKGHQQHAQQPQQPGVPSPFVRRW